MRLDRHLPGESIAQGEVTISSFGRRRKRVVFLQHACSLWPTRLVFCKKPTDLSEDGRRNTIVLSTDVISTQTSEVARGCKVIISRRSGRTVKFYCYDEYKDLGKQIKAVLIEDAQSSKDLFPVSLVPSHALSYSGECVVKATFPSIYIFNGQTGQELLGVPLTAVRGIKRFESDPSIVLELGRRSPIGECFLIMKSYRTQDLYDRIVAVMMSPLEPSPTIDIPETTRLPSADRAERNFSESCVYSTADACSKRRCASAIRAFSSLLYFRSELSSSLPELSTDQQQRNNRTAASASPPSPDVPEMMTSALPPEVQYGYQPPYDGSDSGDQAYPDSSSPTSPVVSPCRPSVLSGNDVVVDGETELLSEALNSNPTSSYVNCCRRSSGFRRISDDIYSSLPNILARNRKTTRFQGEYVAPHEINTVKRHRLSTSDTDLCGNLYRTASLYDTVPLQVTLRISTKRTARTGHHGDSYVNVDTSADHGPKSGDYLSFIEERSPLDSENTMGTGPGRDSYTVGYLPGDRAIDMGSPPLHAIRQKDLRTDELEDLTSTDHVVYPAQEAGYIIMGHAHPALNDTSVPRIPSRLCASQKATDRRTDPPNDTGYRTMDNTSCVKAKQGRWEMHTPQSDSFDDVGQEEEEEEPIDPMDFPLIYRGFSSSILF